MPATDDKLLLGVVWFVAFLFSTTLHEAAHALAAWKLGDPTAYEGGQVSLNPLPHIRREPFGMVLMPVLSFVSAGWMMGWASAPYDPRWAARYPRRSAWMALAGPAANLLLVGLAGLGIRAGLAAGLFRSPAAGGFGFARLVEAAEPGAAVGAAALLSILFTLNLVLFAFNLLPLPPLDGSGIVPLLLPTSAARSYLVALRQPLLSLLGIIVAWKLFGTIFAPILGLALGLLYP